MYPNFSMANPEKKKKPNKKNQTKKQNKAKY